MVRTIVLRAIALHTCPNCMGVVDKQNVFGTINKKHMKLMKKMKFFILKGV